MYDMERDYFLKRLKENTAYKLALKSVSKDQAKKISAMVESWLYDATEPLVAAIDRTQQDPEFRSSLLGALRESEQVVIDDEPEASGSSG